MADVPADLQLNDAGDTSNNLTIRDVNGDVVSRGTLMAENESYERIIEGYKIAGDAALHLAAREPDNANAWRVVATQIDRMRQETIDFSRTAPLVGFRPSTIRTPSKSMTWREARDRLRYGLGQVSGAMRQMATYHRGMIEWSKFASLVETFQERVLKLKAPRRAVRQQPTGIVLQ